MYFIEHFLDLAKRDGHEDYIRMMQRDIIRVVDAVAPDDGSGAANVKVVRKVSHLETANTLKLQLRFFLRFCKTFKAKATSRHRL